MKIENQVCSLEQAKRLKELGVEQKSYLCFSHPKESYIPNWQDKNSGYKVTLIKGDLYGYWTGYEHYSAFTVAELGMMLPTGYDTMRLTKLSGTLYQWAAYDDSDMPFGEDIYFETESQARAGMLIYLLEKNIITTEEVNKRLVTEDETH